MKFLAHGGGGIEANDVDPTIASIDREQRLTYTYPHPTNWGAFEVVSLGRPRTDTMRILTFTAIV